MTHKCIKGQVTIKDTFQGSARNDHNRRQFVISNANYLCGKQLLYTLAEKWYQHLIGKLSLFVFQDSTYPCYPPYYSKDSSSIFFVFFAGWSLPVNAKVAQGSVCGPLLSFVSIHSVEDLIWFDAFKFYLHAEGWQIVSPAWTFSLKACFAYFHLPIQTSTWSSTRQCRFNVKPEFLIFSWQFAPLTVFLSSVEKLLGQKLWSHSFFFFTFLCFFFFSFLFYF